MSMGTVSHPVSEEEIVAVLDAADRGELTIAYDVQKSDTEHALAVWDHVYAGNVAFRLGNGWIVVVFNDCDEWDYIDSIILPDGAVVAAFYPCWTCGTPREKPCAHSHPRWADWEPRHLAMWIPEKRTRTVCPMEIPDCICLIEGASRDMHGKRPVKCATCGGETGIHKAGCPSMDTRLVFGALNPNGEEPIDPKANYIDVKVVRTPEGFTVCFGEGAGWIPFFTVSSRPSCR
jgi:hypothetical protein